MNVDDITVKQAKEIMALFGVQPTVSNNTQAIVQTLDAHWEIGKVYLIRTVTMIDTGIVTAVTDKEVVLEDAAWIADTGRFADALKQCEFNEVEPFPAGKVIINRAAIIDAVQISKTQRDQK